MALDAAPDISEVPTASPSGRRRWRASLPAASLLAASLLLTGCGEDDPASAPASPGQGTVSESTPPTTSPPAPTTSPGGTGPTSSGGTTAASTPTPGTSIPGEPLATSGAQELQREVDEGHQPWRTDMAAVAEAFTHHQLGWTHARARVADPHTVEVTDEATGRIVVLQLRQPAREGDGGIWVVVSGVWVV